MFQNLGLVAVEEHKTGDATWIAVRARGADWSWLTEEDAVCLARHLLATYGGNEDRKFTLTVH